MKLNSAIVEEINVSINKIENYDETEKDSTKIKSKDVDSNTIDPLKLGVTFYNYNAFNLCWYVRSSTVNQDGSIDTEDKNEYENST